MQGVTTLHGAVASWLATLDVLVDTHAAGSFGYLREGLGVLVPLAEAAEPGPLRDAVLGLAERYDDLNILSAAGLNLPQEVRTQAVERVLERFDALIRMVET